MSSFQVENHFDRGREVRRRQVAASPRVSLESGKPGSARRDQHTSVSGIKTASTSLIRSLTIHGSASSRPISRRLETRCQGRGFVWSFPDRH